MRNLETDDLFLVVDIIDALGVEELINAIGGLDINNYRTKNEKGEYILDEEKWGTVLLEKLSVFLVRNLKKCKGPLYEFLSSLKGVTPEEIGKQSPIQTVKDIKELLNKREFSDLFSQALESHK